MKAKFFIILTLILFMFFFCVRLDGGAVSIYHYVLYTQMENWHIRFKQIYTEKQQINGPLARVYIYIFISLKSLFLSPFKHIHEIGGASYI